MAPTIRDVAKLANVAPSTVSAVLNDKRYIKAETRARILSAIQKLDYTPSRSARGLANRTSGNIGFIVANTHFSHAEPFYTRVFLGVEFEARHHDLYVLLTSVNGKAQKPEPMPRFLLEQNVDGVLIAGRVPDKLLKEVMQRKVPTVLVDYDGKACDCSKVLIDNEEGARAATAHLLDLGHRDIAFVGGEKDHPSAVERLRGYHQALATAKVAPSEELEVFEGDTMSTENGSKAFTRMWKSGTHPTAVVCANDATAFGVQLAAKELKLKLPEDLSLMGFDDVVMSGLVDPPLSTIRVDKEELGATALRVLVDRIRRGGGATTTRVGVELIQRGSTMPPREKKN
ncbi:LacI family transcriptional regulator [bacterium]|nr:LacI family transcriptional regulator [bacterium]